MRYAVVEFVVGKEPIVVDAHKFTAITAQRIEILVELLRHHHNSMVPECIIKDALNALDSDRSNRGLVLCGTKYIVLFTQ